MFKQDTTCPALLIVTHQTQFSYTGLSPSMAALSRAFFYLFKSHVGVLQPRQDKSQRFGLIGFRSPLLTESHSLSFPLAT